ncbi:MAG: VRR-NUC domain-containing protein [Oscillospiraceae bacterium]
MEKDIERYLRKKVKALGGLAPKWVSPGWDGAPDRILLLPGGRVLFAETKDTGEKPSKKQLLRHQQLRDLGFIVTVPDSRTAVDNLLRGVAEE